MIDLTTYEGVGVVFMPVWMPDAAAVTSISLRLGNNNANYVQLTVTRGYLGAFISQDWFLVAFDLASDDLTTVGTPDFSAINYVRVTFNYDGVRQNNERIGGLWVSLPSPYEIIFETPAIFVPQDSTTPQKVITNDNDALILGDAAYQIYTYECAREIALGKGGTIASGLIAAIDLVLEGDGGKKLGLYQKFRGDNPNQSIRQVGSWG